MEGSEVGPPSRSPTTPLAIARGRPSTFMPMPATLAVRGRPMLPICEAGQPQNGKVVAPTLVALVFHEIETKIQHLQAGL